MGTQWTDMIIDLYSSEFTYVGMLKNRIKQILGRELRGPQSVIRSLVAGVQQHGVEIRMNDPACRSGIACIISNAGVLTWALNQKKKGRIKYIIAGPDTGMPLDRNRQIFDSAIDRYIVPAPWVADFCCSFGEELRSRIRVWPAGVATIPDTELQSHRQGIIVYRKNAPDHVTAAVIQTFIDRNIPHVIFEYGNFQHTKYLDALKAAAGMVYLSVSESQGLALHEAWMCDVPTLVYNGSHLRNNVYEWLGTSPAPYLTPTCGVMFANIGEFPSRLKYFLDHRLAFQPRDYHLQNFTDAIAAKKYLQLIKEL